jgi:hypothetical protein
MVDSPTGWPLTSGDGQVLLDGDKAGDARRLTRRGGRPVLLLTHGLGANSPNTIPSSVAPPRESMRKGIAIRFPARERTIIEFLLLEGRPGDEIAQRLHDVYGQDACFHCRASAFRWIPEVCRGNEELRNKGHPGRPVRHLVDAAIRPIL